MDTIKPTDQPATSRRTITKHVGYYKLLFSERESLDASCNNVKPAIKTMGGVEKAAARLKISVSELNEWCNENYIPDPWVRTVSKLTNYRVDALQAETWWQRETWTTRVEVDD